MGSIKTDSINQFARRGYLVRVTCTVCGHQQLKHPVEMMQALHSRKISLRVEVVERHLKCSECGARAARIEPSMP